MITITQATQKKGTSASTRIVQIILQSSTLVPRFFPIQTNRTGEKKYLRPENKANCYQALEQCLAWPAPVQLALFSGRNYFFSPVLLVCIGKNLYNPCTCTCSLLSVPLLAVPYCKQRKAEWGPGSETMYYIQYMWYSYMQFFYSTFNFHRSSCTPIDKIGIKIFQSDV